MNDPPHTDDPFVQAVRRQSRRSLRQRGSSDGLRLGQIAGVGWLIALPAVAGALLGRWIDRQAGSGLSCTLSLLALGLILGGAAAWRQIRQDLEA